MERIRYLNQIKEAFKQFPVVAILGARQVGKTTISRFFESKHNFDLENQIYANRHKRFRVRKTLDRLSR